MSDALDKSAATVGNEPSAASVQNYLLYGLSLPERALRSGASIVAGTVREGTSLLVPRAFQDSKTYSVLVRQMLDYLADDIGGVQRAAGASAGAPPAVENFVARKAVGNFVEMAGLATLHVSPLTVLAVLSDLAYGSSTLLGEWGEELKRQGVIDPSSTILQVDDLLEAVARASRVSAEAFDTPPLSYEGLRETVEQTRAAVAQIDPTKLIPQAELQAMWQQMRELANREGVSLADVSTAIALSSLSKLDGVGRGVVSGFVVVGNLFDRHILDHYRSSLADVRERGLYASLAETATPYIEAVWRNFSAERATLTEDLLSGKLVGQVWSGVRRWLGLADKLDPPAIA
ncbi:MAG: hypothetical protein K1X74_21970 [Pirellulales bacterium]|nr:hypothetical protein [Pirellulales bacterium]